MVIRLAAPKGHRFWELGLKNYKKKKKYEDPDELLKDCIKYFEWIMDNPLEEEKVVTSLGIPKKVKINKLRAMTIYGLTNSLGITPKTWQNWRRDETLLRVVSMVDNIIHQQQSEGAAGGQLSGNIVSQLMGLANKVEMTGKNGNPLITANINISKDDDPKEALAKFEAFREQD